MAVTTSSLGLADKISLRAKLPTSLDRGHQSRRTMSRPFCSCTCTPPHTCARCASVTPHGEQCEHIQQSTVSFVSSIEMELVHGAPPGSADSQAARPVAYAK